LSTSRGGSNDNASTNGATNQQMHDAPALYVLNAAAVTKPNAVQHLAADLVGYGTDIAVVTETHLKQRHDDCLFGVDGHVLFRRDRTGRRGGGVAVYVSSRLQATVWVCPHDVADHELLWIRVQSGNRDVLVGALYHPPKPIYQPSALLDHLKKKASMRSLPSYPAL